MRKISRLFIIFNLAFHFLSCKETKNKLHNSNLKKIDTTSKLPQKILVDYKKSNYKISIGEDYKISEKIIDWQWAAMADNDDKIDSTGKDVFLFLGEPLIKLNNGEYLPTLFIETDKNNITKFTCSVYADFENDKRNIEKLLKLMSKYIEQLNDKKIFDAILKNGEYVKETENIKEKFRVTKLKDSETSNDTFEYIITLKQ